MSKVSFRPRPPDSQKQIPVLRADEVQSFHEYDNARRSVPKMPTGMEKDEEEETHLKEALSAQQTRGTTGTSTIPIPEVELISADEYQKLYSPTFQLPDDYISINAFGADYGRKVPMAYNMDDEDIRWFKVFSGRFSSELDDLLFERLMEALEDNLPPDFVAPSFAQIKAVLSRFTENEKLQLAVYEHWLQRRKTLGQGALCPQVLTERLAGQLGLAVPSASAASGCANNPYMAFRRRSERMQTRKNRKNDENNYIKMLKLRSELSDAYRVLDLIRKRERWKKDVTTNSLKIFEAQVSGKDWNDEALSTAISRVQPVLKVRQRISLPMGSQNRHSSRAGPRLSIENWLSNSKMPRKQLTKPEKAAKTSGNKALDLQRKRKFSKVKSPLRKPVQAEVAKKSQKTTGVLAAPKPIVDPALLYAVEGPFAFQQRVAGARYHWPLRRSQDDWLDGADQDRPFSQVVSSALASESNWFAEELSEPVRAELSEQRHWSASAVSRISDPRHTRMLLFRDSGRDGGSVTTPPSMPPYPAWARQPDNRSLASGYRQLVDSCSTRCARRRPVFVRRRLGRGGRIYMERIHMGDSSQESIDRLFDPEKEPRATWASSSESPSCWSAQLASPAGRCVFDTRRPADDNIPLLSTVSCDSCSQQEPLAPGEPFKPEVGQPMDGVVKSEVRCRSPPIDLSQPQPMVEYDLDELSRVLDIWFDQDGPVSDAADGSLRAAPVKTDKLDQAAAAKLEFVDLNSSEQRVAAPLVQFAPNRAAKLGLLDTKRELLSENCFPVGDGDVPAATSNGNTPNSNTPNSNTSNSNTDLEMEFEEEHVRPADPTSLQAAKLNQLLGPPVNLGLFELSEP